jgi:hypothetical protein
MIKMRGLSLLLLLAFLPLGAVAQTNACTSSEHRQFDFWLGDWNVYNQQGSQVGTNSITLEQGDCVLHEHWVDTQGGTGESFNMYDARRGAWHQTWVASNGNLLLLDGGLEDGRMVLLGERRAQNGTGIVLNRISWIPQPDGSVHQVWDMSADDGENWQSAFFGIYRKRNP